MQALLRTKAKHACHKLQPTGYDLHLKIEAKWS